MTSLDISANLLAVRGTAVQAGKALAEMLKVNSILRELDVSANAPTSHYTDGPGFAKELAIGVGANGALNKLTISGDSRRSEAVTIETSMTKADFSGKVLEASGAIMLAAFLPKCQ